MIANIYVIFLSLRMNPAKNTQEELRHAKGQTAGGQCRPEVRLAWPSSRQRNLIWFPANAEIFILDAKEQTAGGQRPAKG